MIHQKTKQTSWIVGVLTSVMGFSGLAFAHPPVNIPPFTQEILDRLDQLEAKIDSQATDLRGVTQNWDKELDSNNGDIAAGREGCDSDRFTCLFGDTAVRDNETGLVWDRSPDITVGPGNDGKFAWSTAIDFCIFREIGGQKGFHLPLMAQLASLVDSDSALCLSGGPCLPDGHPFLNVQSDQYWSATTHASSQSLAHNVDFTDGGTGGATIKESDFNWWCVRGGQTFDGNTHDTLH